MCIRDRVTVKERARARAPERDEEKKEDEKKNKRDTEWRSKREIGRIYLQNGGP